MNEPGRVIVAKALKTMLEKEIGVTYISEVALFHVKEPAAFQVKIFDNVYTVMVQG